MMRDDDKMIVLRDGRERSVLRRHPWIFSGSIQTVFGSPEPGETVAVFSAGKAFLGYGAYSPASLIRVKMWSFGETRFDAEELFRKRFAEAFELRKAVFGGVLPDAWRLINAESDGLPGLVVDVYSGYAVCQIASAGAERFRSLIADVVLKYAKGALERSDVDSRTKEGLAPRVGHFAGEPLPPVIEFEENGVRFRMAPETGHKTGFYLDQRENRRLVGSLCSGAENVLNCFSYTGGFGLAALRGGAKHVLNVDSSAPSLALARENAALNGFSPDAFETQEADVFHFLRTCRDSRRTFDAIVLDPPKFAENASQREKAARAYKDVNLLAMKLLRPGGRLFTFSCSGAMDSVLFRQVVDSAAADAKRDFRITHWLAQGPDHPVSASFPEGRYLKGLAGIVL